jgi:hypothetical protein
VLQPAGGESKKLVELTRVRIVLLVRNVNRIANVKTQNILNCATDASWLQINIMLGYLLRPQNVSLQISSTLKTHVDKVHLHSQYMEPACKSQTTFGPFDE